MHVPMRESRIHGYKPRINCSFARMDLLSATDKANNDSPVRMAIHTRDQELRLGVGESGTVLFPLHKTRGLSQIPRALRLIEDGNVFGRRTGIEQCIVAKVMNVLDKSSDACGNFPLPHWNTNTLLTCNLVTGECFTKHSDKRTVP